MKGKLLLTSILSLALLLSVFSTALGNSRVDRSKPTVPTNIKITKLTNKSASITWSPSRDNVKVDGYQIFVNGEFRNAVNSPNYALVNLAQNTTYQVQIVAFDEARNFSGASKATAVKTTTWPVAVPSTLTSPYGPRWGTLHAGIDLASSTANASIVSFYDGTVVFAGNPVSISSSLGSMGNVVVIRHVINGKHVQSVYMHLQDGSITVKQGQTIKANTKIGVMGNTGQSVGKTGIHLHFETLESKNNRLLPTNLFTQRDQRYSASVDPLIHYLEQ